MLNIPAYLDRIGYAGPIAPEAATLRALHRAHMLTVPFENLDIALNRAIVCDEAPILDKILTQHRGGFCYELNGAFAALLRALDFRVTLLSARVARDNGGEGPEFDHLTLRVDLEEPWLADVGFGESFLDPLRLTTEVEQEQAVGKFRITDREARLHLERFNAAGTWKPQYSFTLQPHQFANFAGMCLYHQTSPLSSFTQNQLCTLATTTGRITLADRRLIITTNGAREERLLTETERTAALEDYFGVRL